VHSFRRIPAAAAALLLLLVACSRQISEHDRLAAANLASEAQFAETLRDWPRAEKLLTQATQLDPAAGDLWLNLGATRRHSDNLRGARAAYESAVAAYTEQAVHAPDDARPVLQEIYALALLGRSDDARQVLARARARRPDNRELRLFAENAEFERMLASAAFKELAL